MGVEFGQENRVHEARIASGDVGAEKTGGDVEVLYVRVDDVVANHKLSSH